MGEGERTPSPEAQRASNGTVRTGVELSPIGLSIVFELDDPSLAAGPDTPYGPDVASVIVGSTEIPVA